MSRPPRGALVTFAARLGIALLVSTTFVAGAIFAVNQGIEDRVASIKRVQLNLAPEPSGGANYLILGSDTRDQTDPGHVQANGGADAGCNCSDTLMVA